MDINLPEIVAKVSGEFARYETALTANDVAMLTELFWASKHTLRFGAEGSLYGHDAIVAFRAARPAAPRPRKLLSSIITTFGTDAATANAEFQNLKDTLIGCQSQTWLRMPRRLAHRYGPCVLFRRRFKGEVDNGPNGVR